MAARVLVVDPNTPDPESIGEAARLLGRGGLVAFPTETVYGLGAIATDEAAVRRIFVAKDRPPTHPLIVHVEDAKAAKGVAASWSSREDSLAKRFWPGPLTLVLPKTSVIPGVVTGGGSTVAVRSPAHAVAQALLRAVGAPIAAPSANRYQSISPTTAAHVVKSLGAYVPLILDGGPCAAGIESTVLDLSGATPRLLRLGVVSIDELRGVLGTVDVAIEGEGAGDTAVRSPGLDARHYAPRAKVSLANDQAAAIREVALRISQGERVGLLAREDSSEAVAASAQVVVLVDSPVGYARQLYAALHALDDAGVDRIVIVGVPAGADWDAVRDRLHRAAGGGVIDVR